MAEWVAIIQAGGTVAVLAVFGWLFWRGEIVSKATVDKIAGVYEDQAKALSNGFLAKLEASTDRQCQSVGDLVIVIRENIVETRASRERMQEVVRDFTKSLSAIEAKQNGVAAPRRRKK